MNAWMRLFEVVTGIQADAAAEPTEFRESRGVTVDADDDDWRRLSGDHDRDLSPMTQARMQKLAHHQWESNLLANRLIELPLAYLLAKGIRLKVADEDLQKVLDRHWRDGINAWPIKLVKKVRELALFGEQCWPTFVSEAGFVRIGYLDPALIATVVTDPQNAEQPIGIVTMKDRRGQARRYRVIVNVPEDSFDPRTREIRSTFTDGECFFFRVNDLCSTTRGRSDLLAQIDWLDAYDQFLFGELERVPLLRAVFYDVTLKGATPDQVEERARKISAPAPRSIRVHNEQEEWKVQVPELGAYEAGAGAQLFRNHVLGGATMPEHWYGGAGDVNRATGASMAEPTEKMYEMRQQFIGHMLEQVATYVLRKHWRLDDAAELSEEHQAHLDSLSVEWPEMTAKDTTKYAAALVQVVNAAASAIGEGLLTRESALALIAAIAAQLGVELDVESELKKAQQQHATSGDAFDPALVEDETTNVDGDPTEPVDTP